MSTDWHERWRDNRIGFHQDTVHRDLETYESQFLGSGAHRVLVPLCGKSVDLVWLAERGHEVLGVEIVPLAVEAFFREWGREPTRATTRGIETFQAGPLTIHCADFFSLTPETLGRVDRVWDRAALIALPPDVRRRYVAHLKALAPGARLLQNALDYDTRVMDGPPYSVPAPEIGLHYPGAEVLGCFDALASEPRWREAGHTSWNTTTYLATLPE
jgi:thiopurine S-methyltransferase